MAWRTRKDPWGDCVTPQPWSLTPSVCFGAVMHERHTVANNRFVYPVAFLRVPLSNLATLRAPLLGVERRGIFSLRSADHGPRDGSPLLPWVRSLLAEHGLSRHADGEVVLHTMPRVFGYVFNPVSFWFCHDRVGQLRVVLAEVNNTFGETHRYLVFHPDIRPIEPGETLHARKVFHVSPFFPVQGEYRFCFDSRDGLNAVSIDYYDDGEKQLSTRVGGRAQALDGAAMWRWLLRYPLMTFGVVFRIHFQALRLWSKKVRFHRKPPPPLEETTT